ncbi:hypothetical protein SAMN06273572_101506 [Monaibacterium marinum]|uniref:Sulfotransferase family protein n=1 Tax=Pontivivens marinum TaxID=1690039 RepID=A0A2C9CN65_9RHOB|nr:hypothetical protein [Monaibacterium marinum]SOH92658.1 hypothetical protein SAMN06273572_101506 [Monaibacterium marinum]
MTDTKTIIWHLGPQKTGTTSIQSMLATNREHLSQWVTSTCIREHSWRLAKSLAQQVDLGETEPNSKTTRNFARLTASWRKSDVPSMIISDETLIGPTFIAQGLTTRQRLVRITPLLQKLSEGYNHTIVLYARPQDDWYKSAYKWAIWDQGEAREYDEWLTELEHDPDWDSTTSQMREATSGTVELVDMNTESDDPAPLGTALLRAANVPDDAIASLEPVAPKNESISNGALAFLRNLNREIGLFPNRPAVRKAIMSSERSFTNETEL